MVTLKTTIICVLTWAMLAVALPCYSADLSIDSKVNISGNIATTGCIEWSDGSMTCNASNQDIAAVWGRITGLMQDQSDLAAALEQKEDKTNRGRPFGYAPLDAMGKVPMQNLPPVASLHRVTVNTLHASDFVPTWQRQGNEWLAFEPAFSLTFTKDYEDTNIRLSWTDSIGTYGPNWCNVGLFIDDSLTPACVGAWSGSDLNVVFNQQSIVCNPSVTVGTHTITVKHRSQYCLYGNYAWDDYGLDRRLTVEEF